MAWNCCQSNCARVITTSWAKKSLDEAEESG